MSEPTITCPNCNTKIKLTESLAAPLLAATREEYEGRLKQMGRQIVNREKSIHEKEQQLAKERNRIDELVADQVESTLKTERARIVAEESRKAKLASANELETKARELADLHVVLNQDREKLAQAQKAQADLIRKERELEDAKRELELTVEKRVFDGIDAARASAKREAEESLKLRVMEKDQTISSMQQTIEELKKKAEQGSQQLQGEVQELELENLLRQKFPFDLVEPVPKGEFGGDIVHKVVGASGQVAGIILWESKRTKNWSDAWLSKLRDDQRAAKAEVSVLISQALPKGVDSFEIIDGVWIASPRVALPVATILRDSLLQISMARQASEGQQTKTEMVYQYLTGPRFRQRVEAIVEAFSNMKNDLDRERMAITKQWAKREEQIERVMGATVGMYGDLQGIAGRSLQEIEGLSFPALGDGSSPKS